MGLHPPFFLWIRNKISFLSAEMIPGLWIPMEIGCSPVAWVSFMRVVCEKGQGRGFWKMRGEEFYGIIKVDDIENPFVRYYPSYIEKK